MDWKILAFIVLMSYVTASAADTESTQWKRFVAMIFGIYSTAFFCMLLLALYIEMALL